MNSELNFAKQIKQKMYGNQFILTYRGEISQQIILALLDMTERKLDSANTQVNIKSKIFKVIIGCLQDITTIGEASKYAKSSMFAIGQVENGYQVYSGNALRNEHITNLDERLDRITDMSENELQELYRIWLKSREAVATDTSMGLIDIARKTGNKIEYDYEAIDDEYSYFALRTTVEY